MFICRRATIFSTIFDTFVFFHVILTLIGLNNIDFNAVTDKSSIPTTVPDRTTEEVQSKQHCHYPLSLCDVKGR